MRALILIKPFMLTSRIPDPQHAGTGRPVPLARVVCGLAAGLTLCAAPVAGASAEVSGELKKWHKVTLTFSGPHSGEKATPNPFMDYRLDVTFTRGARRYRVPGYYAADGKAAHTGAGSGNRWRAHFTPDPRRRVLHFMARIGSPRLIGLRSTRGLTTYDLTRGTVELFDAQDRPRAVSEAERQVAFEELVHTWEATRALEPQDR